MSNGTNLRNAIDYYHSLLDDENARASQFQLDNQQQRRGLFFGARPICTVLRPRFLTTVQYGYLRAAIHAVMPAFQKAYVDKTVEIPLYYRKQVELANPRLGNYLTNGSNVGSTWNGEDWYVKQ